jgi:hypothetical protein
MKCVVWTEPHVEDFYFMEECDAILRSIPKIAQSVMPYYSVSNPCFTEKYKQEIRDRLTEFKKAIDKFVE